MVFTNFFHKKSLQAFTLVEVMVALVVIGIVVFWIARINFNQVTDTQKVSIFSNKIVSTIEWIRNMTLTWKSVTTSQYTPSEWTLNIVINSASTYIRPYYRNSWWTLVEYPQLRFRLQENELVTGIRCKSIDGTYAPTTITSWTFTISFTDNSTTFSGCATDERIIEIYTQFKAASQTIVFNGITSIIESVD